MKKLFIFLFMFIPFSVESGLVFDYTDAERSEHDERFYVRHGYF